MSNTPQKIASPRTPPTPHRDGAVGVGSENVPDRNLLFAVPKKGRMKEKILKLLDGMGIQYTRMPRLDIAHSSNMNISLVFLPAKDIGTFVAYGHVDLGITGQDIIAESNCNILQPCEEKHSHNHTGEGDIREVVRLGMGKCKLCLQAPVAESKKPASFWAGKRIATSFPHLTRKFFEPMDKKLGVQTQVFYISGSVEVACGLGLADAVVDLVETGTTMRAAGLDIVEVILKTQAVLVANPRSPFTRQIQQLATRAQGYLTAMNYEMMIYNIPRSKLAQACRFTPGIQAPTIMALGLEGWVGVSALIPKKKASSIMDGLANLGATGILTTAVANSRLVNSSPFASALLDDSDEPLT